MGYQNGAAAGFEDMLALVIADRPSTITREREDFTDKFRGKAVASAGPYTVRIEAFRATRVYGTFDEKGAVATNAYVLLGLDIPREVSPGVPTFKLGDHLVDGDGNRYRISAPPRYTGRSVELNLELAG